MARTNKEKDPMNINQTIEGSAIEFETIPPLKGQTKAQKPKLQLELLQEGDEYISIKAESGRITEKEEQK